MLVLRTVAELMRVLDMCLQDCIFLKDNRCSINDVKPVQVGQAQVKPVAQQTLLVKLHMTAEQCSFEIEHVIGLTCCP